MGGAPPSVLYGNPLGFLSVQIKGFCTEIKGVCTLSAKALDFGAKSLRFVEIDVSMYLDQRQPLWVGGCRPPHPPRLSTGCAPRAPCRGRALAPKIRFSDLPDGRVYNGRVCQELNIGVHQRVHDQTITKRPRARSRESSKRSPNNAFNDQCFQN